jgi:hypothetical protein
LIPIFGRNDARMNEQIAIGRSLKPSRTLAEDFEIPNSAAPVKSLFLQNSEEWQNKII